MGSETHHHPRRGLRRVLAAAALLVAALAAPASTATAAPQQFPEVVDLPDGFLPEGIAIDGTTAYFGSRADGDIYAADLRTGEGSVISQGPGTPSVGLKYADGLLYVAGGTSGMLRVVDVGTGAILTSHVLGSGETFVNDVLVTGDDVWVTDSRQAALFRIPLATDGVPAPQTAVQRLPLTGEWVQAPAGTNSANGIAPTPDGTGLIVANSSEAALFRVDPATGYATRLDIGAPMTNADGLLLQGRTLYVVQNRLNRVAVVRLDSAGTTGTVTGYLTSPLFEVPTTVARLGRSLYLPNAQFGSPDQVDFEAVRIDSR